MKDEEKVRDTFNQNQPTIGRWKRFWDAYQLKMLTDQSFRATVVAFQVLGFIVILVSLMVLLLEKSRMGLPGQKQKTPPGYTPR